MPLVIDTEHLVHGFVFDFSYGLYLEVEFGKETLYTEFVGRDFGKIKCSVKISATINMISKMELWEYWK